MKKSPQLEKEMLSTRKRSNLQAKTKHPRDSFENTGNQLKCMDCANLSWQLKFYKQNSVSRRRYCFLSSCLSWLRLRHYTACDWLNIPAVIFVGSCVENLILYFPQIWLAIRYLDGGNDWNEKSNWLFCTENVLSILDLLWLSIKMLIFRQTLLLSGRKVR